MRMHLKLCLAWTVLCISSATAWADRIIHYKDLPITISLTTNQEQSIRFTDHVEVGMSLGVQQAGLFRVQTAQGVVHIKANRPFAEQRIQVRRVSDGRVILLDLVATDGDASEPAEPISVLLDVDNVVDGKSTDEAKQELDSAASTITPVDLVRYAATQLYAPSRLHKVIAGISEAPLKMNGQIRAFKGQNRYKTRVTPIIGYRGGAYYLAALHIKNVSPEPVQLDYLDLNLPFSHAVFQHHTLTANGFAGDATTLYLVSEAPLKETLVPWTFYQDVRAANQEEEQ